MQPPPCFPFNRVSSCEGIGSLQKPQPPPKKKKYTFKTTPPPPPNKPRKPNGESRTAKTHALAAKTRLIARLSRTKWATNKRPLAASNPVTAATRSFRAGDRGTAQCLARFVCARMRGMGPNKGVARLFWRAPRFLVGIKERPKGQLKRVWGGG